MPNLTRWSLYELEQIAKRKGYDIDRLRSDYWDEMVGKGLADQEGSVRREALKSRVFEQPVESPEQKAPWYEKILAPAGSKIREAGLESVAANWPRLLAGAAETPADLLAAGGRAVSGIPGIGKPAEEVLTGSSELIQDEIRKLREMSEQAPVTRPESAMAKIGGVGAEIGGELARFAPYLMAGGAIPGFAAGEAIPAYARGEPIGHVITEGAKGAALGAGFEAASMLPLIYRLPAMAAVSGALPALEGAPPGEIATAAGLGGVLGALGSRKPARFAERLRRKPQSKIVEEPVSVSPEEEALAALREARPPTPPIEPPPPAAPAARAVEPPVRTDLDLIEQQRNVDLTRRASASGRSVEEQAAFETRQGAERAELDAAEIEGRAPKTPSQRPLVKDGRLTQKLSEYTDDELDAVQYFAEDKQLRAPGALKAINNEIKRRQIAESRRIVTPEELESMKTLGQLPTPPTEAKQPWEMTKGEFGVEFVEHGTTSEVVSKIKEGGIKSGWTASPSEEIGGRFLPRTPHQGYDRVLVFRRSDLLNPAETSPVMKLKEGSRPVADVAPRVSAHRQIIEEALDRGDRVPQEVLSEYPDLAGRLPTPPTEAAPTGKPGERGFIKLDALLGSKTNPTAEAKAVDAAISSSGHTPPARPYQDRVEKVRGGITDLLDSLGFRATTWAEHAAEIEARGTLPKAARKPFREAHETGLGGEPPTGWYELQTSPRSVLEARDKAIELKKDLDALLADAHRNGDLLTLRAAKELSRKFNAKVEQVNLMRKSQGESVRIWQQTSKEAMEWALINDGLKAIAARPPRMPLYTNIKKNVLKLVNERKDLSSGQRKELGEQLLRDAVDAWRLNLFSVTSFTLDLIGNLAASVSEGAGLLGEDVGLGVYRMMKGEPQAMGLRSMLQGMKKIGRPAPAEIERALGTMTASGEMVSGMGGGKGNIVQRAIGLGRAGTFTTRSKPVSAIIDNVVGAPLYWKGAVDTGFKRMGAWAALYRKAASEASKLPKTQRADWIRTRVETMKPEEIAEVVEQANKVGFNRQLTGVEESIAASPIFKLAFGAFPRWPFQFTRALGEWIGVNPKAFRQIAKGPNRGQALTNYLGKTATGIGGLYLVNDTLYDNVDFKSMEFVHENGNRTRLSGREPLPTVLALSAAFKGDWENAKNALKYTSLPGASIVSGEGGLLWTLVQRIQQAAQRREFDAKSVEKEAIKMLNKMIPGQALLAAVKSVFDPISREGIGAEIPGVSMALPAKIDPTTGKPLEQYQRIPAIGATIPQVSGVPIPGAQRIVDPVSQLLGSYGMMDYRMPRRPIAGVPASQVPPESQRRWYELLGEERTKVFKTIAPALLAKRKDVPYNTRLDLMGKYQIFERLEKGGYSRAEAAKQAFGETWKIDFPLAMKLNEDKELIQKKDAVAAKKALMKLEQEMRRARRERRL